MDTTRKDNKVIVFIYR